ncbi:hypothetical protein N0V93_004673 [Gnomoniopsis smithogilvyi]|uniref:Uncharacterized protein n=1 Tax=Gnomoniopsis smithogilvyi TaxID=1191159 RepID=A0A9W8YRW8_9PEZI|nr:hypothetical protein N0V93_004673 [Gnomoniopsis smithogilvyi]
MGVIRQRSRHGGHFVVLLRDHPAVLLDLDNYQRPEGISAIAFGEFVNARRSVRQFRQTPDLCRGKRWTLRHAFFANSGGFLLRTPDFPAGFPVNAKQIHYLASHGHVEIPDLDELQIEDRNSADTLSRLIAIWQVFWFSVTELRRMQLGLPITTIELTALTFGGVMICTSILWYHKPCITIPTIIHLKADKTVQAVRLAARQHTHPNLPDEWWRTPLDFISRENFIFDRDYYFMQMLPLKFHLPLLSRKTQKPWERFPCASMDAPGPESVVPLMLGVIFLAFYAFSFCLAWDFMFPTQIEQLLWRVCSVYHGCYTGAALIHYAIASWRFIQNTKDGRSTSRALGERPVPNAAHDIENQAQRCTKRKGSLGCLHLPSWLVGLRNLSFDQDPDVTSSLSGLLAWTAGGVPFCLCRAYFYVEDFISLRSQPADVYVTVDSFAPFVGG